MQHFFSKAPTGAPRNATYTVTSTSINLSWRQIDCIERNGVITNYTVVFQEQGGAVIPGEVNVMDRTFTASRLTPHTNYIFRVAGVNSNGKGPYSNGIQVITEEDGNVCIVWSITVITSDLQFLVLCLTSLASQSSPP